MNILVTGANGQLGREMQRLGAVSPNNYIFTDAAELDVTDAGAVRRAAEQTRAGQRFHGTDESRWGRRAHGGTPPVRQRVR